MRIALIKVTSGTGDDTAGKPLAGRPVAVRQVDLALALGCERIVCLTDSMMQTVGRMQRSAERGGARFHAIPGVRSLRGLVKAADEVLVIASGLLIDRELVTDALGAQAGILAITAEKGCAAGFERIDSEIAWAGVMLVPGATIERLADLPPDSDAISSLLRIAMQHGVRRIPIAPSALDGGGLVLVRDGEAHMRAQKRWIERAMAGAGWRRPAVALVSAAARAFAPRVLAHERSLPLLYALGVVISVAAGGAAWFERSGAAFAILATGAAAFVAAEAFQRIERGTHDGAPPAWWCDWLLDSVFLSIVVLVSPRSPQVALFVAAIVIVAMRMSALHGPGARIAIAGDRMLVFAVGAVAAHFGKILPVMEVFALATLSFDLFERGRSRLTRA